MDINGEQALIAINTGLDMQLTGLENINVKGALLGLSRKRIQEITEGVIEFAEIGDFLYQPVKKYSSGMKSRLGFSISLYLNPEASYKEPDAYNLCGADPRQSPLLQYKAIPIFSHLQK